MNLLNRYILRETFSSCLLVTFVLFAILMSNQFAEILDDAATSQLPKDAVFAVLSLTSLQYITFLMPIGLFLGIMLALARFDRDRHGSGESSAPRKNGTAKNASLSFAPQAGLFTSS